MCSAMFSFHISEMNIKKARNPAKFYVVLRAVINLHEIYFIF